MAIEKILISKTSLEKLKKELNTLVNVDRPKILKELQEARNQGDLSENADYDAAREKQNEIEKKITTIQYNIDNAKLNKDVRATKDSDFVAVYNHVTIYDHDEKKDFTYQIVGAIEIDLSKNKISNDCPLAKAILDHKIGEVIEVKNLEHTYKVTIKAVS